LSINIIWGPPGSGKTTLSTDLLNSYSKNNKNVCLISPDVHSTVSARLGITIPEDKSLNGCLSSDKKTIDALYSLGQGKYLLAWPTGNDAFNNVLCLNDAKRIISQLSSVMDGIIIDGASYPTCALSAWALKSADSVVLLSGCDCESGLWYRSFKRALSLVDSKSIHACMKTRPNMDMGIVNALTGLNPDIIFPYCESALNLKDSAKSIYGRNGRKEREYTAAVDTLFSCLEGG